MRYLQRTRKGLGWALVVGASLAVADLGPPPNRLDAAWQAQPAHTAEQAVAAARAWQAQQHPQWRELSLGGQVQRLAFLGERLVRRRAAAGATPPVADFLGNRSAIAAPSGSSFVALRREADCSLTYGHGTYTVSVTSPSAQLLGSTAQYQQTLHAAAGLATQAGSATGSCADASTGLGMRRTHYLGRTAQGHALYAAAGYHYAKGQNVVWFGAVDPATLARQSFDSLATLPNEIGGALAAGDLNGDGLLDVVGLGLLTGTATVWLARTDGTLGPGTTYTLPGVKGTAAVLADFNGDGKVDLAASSLDASNVERLSLLAGRGDGTLEAARSVVVTTPSPSAAQWLANLLAVDLRGTGRPDIVGSNGVVLLNDGTGVFTQGSAAFAAASATSSYGPNLAGGDFNHDGKADVAVNNGLVIRIALGRGDGTFTTGRSYASNNGVGYLQATDLDRDGHLDLYVGLGNGGVFGGDHFDADKAYALMGNGDGSFQGVPVQPFVYTGRNLVDLNGDGKLDAVGANADASFTTYLGDGSGGFTARSTRSVASISNGSESFTLSSIESFAVGDVNGDGRPDLLFSGKDFIARLPGGFYTPGLLVALGNGQGDFAAPTFTPAPAFAPTGDFDIGLKLTNVRLADVSGDGKADLVYAYSSTTLTGNQYVVGTAVQLGNGNGTFGAPQVIVFHSAAASTSFFQASPVQHIVDLNGDGKLDLILTAQTATIDTHTSGYVSTVQVALGNGDGTFGTPVVVSGPEVFGTSYGTSQQAPIVVADLDGDGRRDLAVLGGSTAGSLQVAVMRGNGDGTFKAPQLKTFAGQYLSMQQQLAVGDFDGDGKADVLIADPFTNASGIALGNGDGTLQATGSAAPYAPSLAIALPLSGVGIATDFNGDGKADALVGSAQLISVAPAAATGPGFTIGTSSSSGSVKAGAAVQTTVTFTPGSGFSGTVTFSCAGLPTGAACQFTPATVAAAGGAANTTLSITTTAGAGAGALPQAPTLPPPAAWLALVLCIAGGWMALQMPARRRWSGPAGLVAAGAFALLPGCGGGGGSSGGSPSPAAGTPAGTYAVTIQASDGTVTRSVPYTLVVN